MAAASVVRADAGRVAGRPPPLPNDPRGPHRLGPSRVGRLPQTARRSPARRFLGTALRVLSRKAEGAPRTGPRPGTGWRSCTAKSGKRGLSTRTRSLSGRGWPAILRATGAAQRLERRAKPCAGHASLELGRPRRAPGRLPRPGPLPAFQPRRPWLLKPAERARFPQARGVLRVSGGRRRPQTWLLTRTTRHVRHTPWTVRPLGLTVPCRTRCRLGRLTHLHATARDPDRGGKSEETTHARALVSDPAGAGDHYARK